VFTLGDLNFRRFLANVELGGFSSLMRLLVGAERHNNLLAELDLNHFMLFQGLYGPWRRYDKDHCIVLMDGFTVICPYRDLYVLNEVREARQTVFCNETVFDIGAHYGFYSLYASRLIGENSKVYSFEPCRRSFNFLRLNCGINKTDNIIPFQIGLSDHDGFDKLYYCTNPSGHSMVFGNFSGYEQVRVCKLDTFISAIQLGQLDYVKVDVEGAELPVLQGAEETLRSFKPRLSVAAYHYENEANDVKRWLEYLGYKPITITSRNIIGHIYNIHVCAS
jgi:FkbM family methyltransferase